MHYFPLTLPFLLILFFLFLFLIVLIEIGILGYAYQRIGVNRRHVFLLLFFSLLGSYFNIAVAQLPAQVLHSAEVVSFYGMHYVIPMVLNHTGTVVAINVGGAVIPVILSLYLIVKNRLFVKSLLAVGFMAAVSYHMASAVPGVGIAEPVLIPPLLAAGISLSFSRQYAPHLAYTAGSLGTLIGADLLNLGRVQDLGAPVVSIGGAGTFDGIFLTGIAAVLLASIVSGRTTPKSVRNSA